MKTLRWVLSVASLAALAVGYLSSQYFAFDGRAAEWAKRADSPPVVWLSLLVLLSAIVLWLVPHREAD